MFSRIATAAVAVALLLSPALSHAIAPRLGKTRSQLTSNIRAAITHEIGPVGRLSYKLTPKSRISTSFMAQTKAKAHGLKLVVMGTVNPITGKVKITREPGGLIGPATARRPQ